MAYRGVARALLLLGCMAVGGNLPALASEDLPPDAVRIMRAEPKPVREVFPSEPRIQPLRHKVRKPFPLVLDRIARDRLAQAKALKPVKGIPHKIGLARHVPDLATAANTALRLNWETTSQGTLVASVSITSPEAVGIRLGLSVVRLPKGAMLRFHPAGADSSFEVAAQEVLDTLRRNADSGDASGWASVYWSPVIDGAEVTFEIELPAGTQPSEVEIALPHVSHLYRSALTYDNASDIGTASYCNRDVSCDPGWLDIANSTAKMIFTDTGETFLCTGTLLSDSDPATQVPYFISANHCIPNQTVASTLQTTWLFRSTACNSLAVNPGYVDVYGGATLLYASSNTDTSFMRLNGSPPAGARFSGWQASLPAIGTSVTDIHQPMGDLQKISHGNLVEYDACTLPDADGYFSCSDTSAALANHLGIQWTSGITDPGSSGSGLFLNGGYLVGTLHGGASSCSTPNGVDNYGRFDVAYNAALVNWLSATPADGVLKEYAYQDGSYFYSALPAEQQTIESGQLGPGWTTTGNSFKVWIRAQPAGGYPVCRFRGDNVTVPGWGHFYTALPSECTAVRNGSAPFWIYEGTGFYAYLPSGTCPAGTVTIYRQYNPVLHNHHFQTSNQLTPQMQAAGWTMEGIPFCVGM